MSSIAKFQLRTLKGTDVFPDAMQAPPRVRTAVQFVGDPREPYNPEVLEDYVKDVLSRYTSELAHFVTSQRQNYNAGIAEYTKTRRSFPEFDVSYSNNQAKHEIIDVTVRVDIRRVGEKKVEYDQLMLLVLHDGNCLTAIPMSSIANPISAYRATCTQSFWGDEHYLVNQLRLGDTYSAVFSEVGLLNRRCTATFSTLMILTDEFDTSLQVGTDDERYGDIMNGSADTIYTTSASYFFDGQELVKSGGGYGFGNAIDASGGTYSDSATRGDHGASNGTFYVCSLSVAGSRFAQPATIRRGTWSISADPVTASYEHNFYRFEYSGGGGDALRCYKDSFVTAVPDSISGEVTEYGRTSVWDGQNLGAITISFTSRSYTNTTGDYVVSCAITAQGITVRWYHNLPPLGDGASGRIPTGSGSYTYQYKSSYPVSTNLSTPIVGDECTVAVVGIVFGVPIPDTDQSIDAKAQAVVEYESQFPCTCQTSRTCSSSGPYVGSGTVQEMKSSGAIYAGRAHHFPYAVDDKLYYTITPAGGSNRDEPNVVHTPHGATYDGDFTGWLNVTNGQHLIQGFLIGEQAHIVLDGADYGDALAAVCGTSVNSINAVFMDVALSKITELD